MLSSRTTCMISFSGFSLLPLLLSDPASSASEAASAAGMSPACWLKKAIRSAALNMPAIRRRRRVAEDHVAPRTACPVCRAAAHSYDLQILCNIVSVKCLNQNSCSAAMCNVECCYVQCRQHGILLFVAGCPALLNAACPLESWCQMQLACHVHISMQVWYVLLTSSAPIRHYFAIGKNFAA